MRLSSIIFFLVTSLTFFAEPLMAQKTRDAAIEDCSYLSLLNKLGLKKDEDRAIRDPSDHTRAFDPKSGRNFFYDKNKQAWIDSKTGESMSTFNLEDCFYLCLLNKLGLKKDEDRAIRDPSDHTRAFDPKSGRNFFWDKDKQAWRDSKTGECICPKCDSSKNNAKTAYKDFTKNEIFVGFSLIREDNANNDFNTYGGELAYTRNLCRRGGLTGDVGVNFGSNGGVDYTKFNILVGGTYYPIKTAVPSSDFSFSIHALAGINSIRSSYIGMSYSNSSFTFDVGPGFNYYFGNKLGLGLRAGYMPSFGKGNTSNNFRVALGLDIR